jgi:hypothetical protein
MRLIQQATALLQRCPNCGERGSMREKGSDGRHTEADWPVIFGNPEVEPRRQEASTYGLPLIQAQPPHPFGRLCCLCNM